MVPRSCLTPWFSLCAATSIRGRGPPRQCGRVYKHLAVGSDCLGVDTRGRMTHVLVTVGTCVPAFASAWTIRVVRYAGRGAQSILTPRAAAFEEVPSGDLRLGQPGGRWQLRRGRTHWQRLATVCRQYAESSLMRVSACEPSHPGVSPWSFPSVTPHPSRMAACDVAIVGQGSLAGDRALRCHSVHLGAVFESSR